MWPFGEVADFSCSSSLSSTLVVVRDRQELSSSLSSWVLLYPQGFQFCPGFPPLHSPTNLKQLQAQHQMKRQQPCKNAPPPLPQFHKIPTINPLFHIIRVICFSDFGIEDEYYYNKNRKHGAMALGPAVKETWRALRKLLAETWLAGSRWGFKEERPAHNDLNYPQLIECSRWEHWYRRAEANHPRCLNSWSSGSITPLRKDWFVSSKMWLMKQLVLEVEQSELPLLLSLC